MASASPTRAKDIPAKIVVLGESAVGKSSLALRFVRRDFIPNQEATIGASFLSRSVSLVDESPPVTIKFEIWDTAGQERYRALAPMYYRGAAGALVVYDITSADSLRKAESWIGELRRNADPQTVVVLVGNKCDLESMRQVSIQQGQDLAEKEELLFYETSAKDGTNVDALFTNLGKTLLSRGVIASGVDRRSTMSRNLQPPGSRTPKSEQQKRCDC
ncbi:rab5 GTP-binding protein, putative [Bodo saltans]|uniref:Rab5 GTP-binding protein, putative n=1 Tax=Bodo saltans TaxID=75058 RepID=A0A0S4KHE5_BODSA|nr:rab5 GTP-binding protein, putative [Bodo saltans]|eukprot:CUI14528.1 rab5 GTP-binding protein, putative [Bodo saltans]